MTHLPASPPSDGALPNRSAALFQYQLRAAGYDHELALFEPLRHVALQKLALQEGDSVLDTGCGTGLSLPALSALVGPSGHVVGVEQCAEMIERAQLRVEQQGLGNVTLQCQAAEAAQLKQPFDAALFHFTHDVLRRPDAVRNVMLNLKAGATVVAAGLQWAPPWAIPMNLFVWSAALYSTTCLDGLFSPWDSLESYLDNMHVETHWGGAIYVATGTRRQR